ncbi:MAG: hypothetical protein JWM33_585 [Caulobacteraceae bacterium]|nr:hypothetical protein [Caulobacteraceae bacterium]
MTKSSPRRLVLGLSITFAAATLNGAASGAESRPTVKTGLWEYSYKLFGLPAGKEKRCLKPADIDKFFAGPCNHNYTCTYPTRVVGGGKAQFEGTWTDKRSRAAQVKASGTYTDVSFDLSVSGKTIQGIPLLASTNAKWLGADCPTGAEGS